MKSYWFYLKPYTFLWSNASHALIYNSLSNIGIEVLKSGKTGNIIKNLQEHSNGYCIELTEKDINDPHINNLIFNVKKSFSGDIIETLDKKVKPVVFPPKLKINKDIKVLREDSKRSVGENILSYLNEVTIHVNGKCNRNCKYCKLYYLQTCCCTKNDYTLSIKKVRSFISQIQNTSFGQINILGGSIFEYAFLYDLCDMLKNMQIRVVLNTNYLNFLENSKRNLSYLSNKNFSLKVFVDSPINESALNKTANLLYNNSIQSEWLFPVTMESEYEVAISFIEKFELKKYKLVPIFSEMNLKFFEKFVFSDKDDLLTSKQTQREIFGKQAINYFDFGKLTVMSDGSVFANPNHEPLGTIKDDIRQMIYKEMDQGTSWRRIRDMNPCSDCVYQWLCPSPSNYELVIGKLNLCNVKTTNHEPQTI